MSYNDEYAADGDIGDGDIDGEYIYEDVNIENEEVDAENQDANVVEGESGIREESSEMTEERILKEIADEIYESGNKTLNSADRTMVNGKIVKIPEQYKWYCEDVWEVMRLHNEELGLCPQQIQSYEHCIDVIVPDYVDKYPSLFVSDEKKGISHEVRFKKFTINMPTTSEHDIVSHHITPQEARLRNLSYMGSCYVMMQHIEHHADETIEHDPKQEWVGQFPIMVGSNKDTIMYEYGNPVESGESDYDPGGYFIVKGGEKVIVGQEHRSPNYVHVNIRAQTKLPEAEIRSQSESGKKTTMLVRWVVNRKWGKVLRVSLPFIKQDVPIGILFCALGYTDEMQIMNFILLGKEDGQLQQLLSASFHEARKVRTRVDACKLIASYSGATSGAAGANMSIEDKIEKIRQYLERDVLPQIEVGENWELRKAYFVGYIVHKLLLVLDKRINPDDRDHYAFKRVETVGPLLMQLFQDRFKKMVTDIKAYMETSIAKGNEIDIHKGVKPKHITTGFLNSLKTGSWNINKSTQRTKGKASKHGQGVAQVLSRLTYMSTLSHLRRISTPSAKESQTAKPRQLHTTHWGSNCSIETPEGGSCLTLDTLVCTPNGNVEIGKLKNGDVVITYDKTIDCIKSACIENYFQRQQEVFEVTTENAFFVKATGDHPFLTKFGWKDLDLLSVGDEIMCFDEQTRMSEYVKITKKISGGQQTVADFTTLNDDHSFIANGFVTHNCGLVKNIPLTTLVTLGQPSQFIIDWLKSKNLIKFIEECNLREIGIENEWKIFVNGTWVGVSNNAKKIMEEFKRARQNEEVHRHTTAHINNTKASKELFIWSDSGRTVRPLFKVVDGKLLFTREDIEQLRNSIIDYNWSTFLDKGWIEYIDSSECMQSSVKIAIFPWQITKDDTHCEIHPSLIYGVVASLIPFPDHNQAPRNTYQCVWEEEPVYMENGTTKKIKDIKVGDRVLTFHPETQEISPSRVINHQIYNTDKKIVNVTTISGRKITVTDDHRIMTNNGWKEAGSITENDAIAISLEQDSVNNVCADLEILSLNEFLDSLKVYNDKRTLSHAESLIRGGLLPLKSSHPYLHVIARIYGFMLTDGSVFLHSKRSELRMSADFGSEYSAKQFEKDMEKLGFPKTKITYGERIQESHGKRIKHHTYTIQHQTSLVSLLVSLGFQPGKKTTQEYPNIPNWIKNGSNLIKREFLAGMQGGDGCQIRYNSMEKTNRGFNFVCGDTLLTVRNEYIQSLRDLMSDVCKMYGDLDIESKVVEYEAKYDGSKQCGIRISCTQENLVKYFQKVGYRYCDKKCAESGKVVEYLLYKFRLQDKYINDVNVVRRLKDNCKKPYEIANITGIDYSHISGILRSYKNKREPVMRHFKEHEKPSNWYLEHKFESIFVPVESVVESQNVRVADITTESENHSFIAGDKFCVHNSAMAKQALGTFATNYRKRLDTISHLLYYPQKPLVYTKATNLLHFDKMAAGENIMVAIACYSGFNQEDSLIINRSAIDRGLFRSITYRTSKQEEKKGNLMDDEQIEIPKRGTTFKMRNHGAYKKLDTDGLVPPGSRVGDGDTIIGKTTPFRDESKELSDKYDRQDASIALRKNETGIIDEVMLTVNEDGYNFVKVRVRSERIPMQGDKFSAR